MSLYQRCLQSPVLLCSFRPFFIFTAGSAVLFMAFWLLVLQGWLPLTEVPGGWTLWHAHELLFGFAAAATAGKRDQAARPGRIRAGCSHGGTEPQSAPPARGSGVTQS